MYLCVATELLIIQHYTVIELYPGKKCVLICAHNEGSLLFKVIAGFKTHLNRSHSTSGDDTCNVQNAHQSGVTEHGSQLKLIWECDMIQREVNHLLYTSKFQ